MSNDRRLTIPENLFDRAMSLAQNQDRQLLDVVNEAIERGLPLVENQVLPTEWEEEIAAFRLNHAAWLKQYAGEYVAVYQGQLVDHDAELSLLLHRVNEQYPESFVLIRPLRSELDIIYEYRSVTWA